MKGADWWTRLELLFNFQKLRFISDHSEERRGASGWGGDAPTNIWTQQQASEWRKIALPASPLLSPALPVSQPHVCRRPAAEH